MADRLPRARDIRERHRPDKMCTMRRTTLTSMIHVLLGAALALPFAALAWAFISAMQLADTANAVLLAVLAAVTAAVAFAVLTAPPVRQMEVAAARLLLATNIPDVRSPQAWDSRMRGLWWFLLNALTGAAVTMVLLVGVPLGVGFLAFPFLDNAQLRYGTADDAVIEAGGGWVVAWVPLVGVAALALTGAVVVAGGALLRAAAPRFLGPTPADKLVLAEARERELAKRNGLARELHDSVGHALTSMLMQASAAGRIADSGKETASPAVRDALAVIESTGRAALDELDHMLGVLRRGELYVSHHNLADVQELVDNSPVPVRYSARGDVRAVPSPVSGEGYRIVQEALTNAVKHGDGMISAEVTVRASEVEIIVRNRLAEAVTPHRAGRGLRGVRERLTLFGGELRIVVQEGDWVFHAHIPFGRI